MIVLSGKTPLVLEHQHSRLKRQNTEKTLKFEQLMCPAKIKAQLHHLANLKKKKNTTTTNNNNNNGIITEIIQ